MRRAALIRNERGLTLVEVLIAMALFGILAVSFLSAFGTGLVVLTRTDERQTAKNLAESQMEHIMKQGFPGPYTLAEIPEEYARYEVEYEVETPPDRDANIQKITVIVTRGGEEVTKLEGYKMGG